MNKKKFQKKVEDFTCAHCGFEVRGTGYTNHCPKCLWGRHVDVHPGDRASTCAGMMEPVRVEGTSPDYVLIHRCKACQFERRNKVQSEDDMHVVVALTRHVADVQ